MKWTAVALSLLAGCVSSNAIREARLEQNRAIAAGDVERAASFWTEDVSARRGLGAAVSGRDEYRKMLGPSPVIYERIPEKIEVSKRWPLAFESGIWVGRASGAEIVRGRYSAQWVKRDGRWLIRSEVFVALTCKGTGCDSAAVP
jgi:ketosteroid isomerase-like protein